MVFGGREADARHQPGPLVLADHQRRHVLVGTVGGRVLHHDDAGARLQVPPEPFPPRLGLAAAMGRAADDKDLGAHPFGTGERLTLTEALHTYTLGAARCLGWDDHLGSIEPGKLADLVVIGGDPLKEIRDSEKVVYTMINGRIYDCETMNEIGNYSKTRAKFWWEANKYSPTFNWHEETNSFMEDNCFIDQ